MVKKSLKVSIDEEVYNKAKSEINNLSLFVEETFRFYLGMISLDDRVKEMQLRKLSDEIDNKQFHRYLIEKSLIDTQNKEKLFIEEKNRRWRRLWNYYNLYRTYDYEKMSDAMIVLGLSEEEIVNVMDTLIEYKDEIDFTASDKWEYALNLYKQVNGVDDGM